ncbi:MAG: hypothetical protein AB1451_08990 [Nitrospirota bacterium]
MSRSDSHHAPPPFREESPQFTDPEPTIADYVLVLARRKRLIAIIVAISVTAGLAHALLATRSYTVQTAIEIGRVNGEKLIDPPETILAKLSHAYIPDVVHTYRALHPDAPNAKVTAKIPKGSEVVVLETRGPLDHESTYRSLHEAISQRLVSDHQRTADQTIRQYESDLSRAKLKLDELSDRRVFMVQEKLLQGEIERAQLRLEGLKDQAKLIETEAKRFDATKKLLTQQVADLRADIASASNHRTQAAPDATDGARAMTLLMLDSQIVDSRSRLRTLEERLYISLENDREKLLKQLADIRRDQEAQLASLGELGSKLVKLRVDNEREKALQQQVITDIETKLTGIRTTVVLTPPARLPDPAGVGRGTIVALYALLGLMAGVFTAFLAEFLQQARSRRYPAGNGAQAEHLDTDVETEAVMWGRR